jgi:ABC-type amino acid transport substrate-binding protein
MMRPLLLTLCGLLLSSPVLAAPETASPASVYDRVMASGTIRCGYINYPPHLIVDPATKKISGISHDIVEEMAALLQLKVEWTEEVGWGSTVEAMRSNRVDAICTSFWQNPVEGRYVAFTIPLFYSAVGAYVRADETRIKPDLGNLDDPKFLISGSDGAVASTIAQQDYPKATLKSLPNMTDETQMLMEVTAGKADIAFIETYLGEKFIKANPGSLKNLVPNKPVRLFGDTFAIPMDDYKFKTMLDSALVQMLYGGRVDKIIKKYEEVPGGIYRVAKPYEAVQ